MSFVSKKIPEIPEKGPGSVHSAYISAPKPEKRQKKLPSPTHVFYPKLILEFICSAVKATCVRCPCTRGLKIVLLESKYSGSMVSTAYSRIFRLYFFSATVMRTHVVMEE